MSHSVIIFDLDGTLLDTLEDLAHAGNLVLERHGYPVHAVESYKYFVGDGMRALVGRITPDSVGESENDRCFAEFKEVYAQCWNRRSQPYDGIGDMLALLRRHGLLLNILSNKPHEFTLMCVDHFFPEKPFEVVFGQRDGVAKKPDPVGALEIAARLGVGPQQCIYVGDSKVDMRTGKSAGMYTIGVLWGFRDADELHSNGADVMVKTPQELAQAILSL